ncbi:MAG: YeeE/YedE family protein [Epsilonproteobacteria bacterium]|nr:YeeE/YedE family protein [Campylobacterota bacterium]
MDVVFPLYTSGFLDSTTNLWLALLIGIMFGFILERAGFSTSAHIAPLFYFRSTLVPKVMVAAITTTATLIFLGVVFGYIDFNNIFIPSTYVWAYLVGGLIFGVGMVMSGWCPGTAVTGVATAKIDAIFFLLGLMFGMFIYFYLYDAYEALREFANSANLGKFTINKLFNTPDLRVAYIATLVMSFGLLAFMIVMKKIADKKGDE